LELLSFPFLVGFHVTPYFVDQMDSANRAKNQELSFVTVLADSLENHVKSHQLLQAHLSHRLLLLFNEES
jgi:negative regulator of sigma E activity